MYVVGFLDGEAGDCSGLKLRFEPMPAALGYERA